MLQTYSVGQHVRVCSRRGRDCAQARRGCSVLDPVREILSEASTVADGALSRERSGF